MQNLAVPSVQNYIFGYGSLINSHSRKVTGETGRAVAVKVSGFARHWSNLSSGFGMSSVVVIVDPKETCNGVLIEVDASELRSFDLREKGYKRVLIELAQVEYYNPADQLIVDQSSSCGKDTVKIWLYQADKVVAPCQAAPVVFSYLDVILAGCLEYSQQFSDDFMSCTQGWQHAMLNDRQAPRYPRVQSELNTQLLNPLISLKAPLELSQISVGYS